MGDGVVSLDKDVYADSRLMEGMQVKEFSIRLEWTIDGMNAEVEDKIYNYSDFCL